MCKMRHADMMKLIDEKIAGCDKEKYGAVHYYLVATGVTARTPNFTELEVDEGLANQLEFMISPIERGDIVFSMGSGLVLVTDILPAAAADGLHFRALKVENRPDGTMGISVKDRSRLCTYADSIRIRKSTFDMDAVEKCSYERYKAYQTIVDINAKLAAMCEQD